MAQTFFDYEGFNNVYAPKTKKCTVCKEVKTLDHFYKSKIQPDGHHYSCKECNKKYREDNKKQIAEHDKAYYQNNKEKYAEHHQKYKIERKEVITNGRKRYYQKIKSKHADYYKEYRKTDKGKEISRRNYANRKKYGFNPINEPFDGADFHHLHVDLDGNDDHDMGIYIPHELHNSIYHSCKTWVGMDEMNKLAIEWYISSGK